MGQHVPKPNVCDRVEGLLRVGQRVLVIRVFFLEFVPILNYFVAVLQLIRLLLGPNEDPLRFGVLFFLFELLDCYELINLATMLPLVLCVADLKDSVLARGDVRHSWVDSYLLKVVLYDLVGILRLLLDECVIDLLVNVYCILLFLGLFALLRTLFLREHHRRAIFQPSVILRYHLVLYTFIGHIHGTLPSLVHGILLIAIDLGSHFFKPLLLSHATVLHISALA